MNFPFSTALNVASLGGLVSTGALGRVERAVLTPRFAEWPRGWRADATGWLARPEQGGFTREVVSHFLFVAARLFGLGRIEEVRTTGIDRITRARFPNPSTPRVRSSTRRRSRPDTGLGPSATVEEAARVAELVEPLLQA